MVNINRYKDLKMEKKIYTVEDYKRLLGAGQRGNMFKIDLIFPSAITDAQSEETFSIMCDTGALPGERAIEPIDVPYEGDHISIAGDKSAPEVLTFAYKNSEKNIYLRKRLKSWSQLIQKSSSGEKTPPSIYKTDQVFISILDYKKEVIEKIQCIGGYINTVNQIELAQEGGDITKTEFALAMDDYVTII